MDAFTIMACLCLGCVVGFVFCTDEEPNESCEVEDDVIMLFRNPSVYILVCGSNKHEAFSCGDAYVCIIGL